MSSWINLGALWKILVLGLICGAGLPALFAVGLRVLGLGGDETGSIEEDRPLYGGKPLGLVLAGGCFSVVLAAIGLGVYWIVSS